MPELGKTFFLEYSTNISLVFWRDLYRLLLIEKNGTIALAPSANDLPKKTPPYWKLHHSRRDAINDKIVYRPSSENAATRLSSPVTIEDYKLLILAELATIEKRSLPIKPKDIFTRVKASIGKLACVTSYEEIANEVAKQKSKERASLITEWSGMSAEVRQGQKALVLLGLEKIAIGELRRVGFTAAGQQDLLDEDEDLLDEDEDLLSE